MRTCISFTFLVFLFTNGIGQGTYTTASAYYTKLGAYSNHQTDVFSFTANQAALASVSSLSAGIFAERRFMLSELNFFEGAVTLPTASGNFGLILHQFGNGDFGEMKAGLAYGRKLGSKVDLGAQFNYHSIRIAGFGNAGAVSAEGGVIFHFTDQFHGGLHIANPTSVSFGKNDEQLAAVFTTGFGYDASENLYFGTEIIKIENRQIDVQGHIQYKIIDKVLIRGGVSSGQSVFFIGAGVQLAQFRFQVTTSLHQQLGLTPGLMIIFKGEARK